MISRFMFCKKLQMIEKEMFYINQGVCCFTGHRSFKCSCVGCYDNNYLKLRKVIKRKIENVIKRGFHTFISGMALGFDMMCAEIILELKKKYKHIKLIGAIPCKNQSERWAKEQKDRYKEIIKKLDGIRCIYDKYISGCMQERNKFMVNNSSLVIAFFNGSSGGTKNTIDYALKQGVKVEIIKP